MESYRLKQRLTLKRGDSISLSGSLESEGSVDFTGWTVRSHLRTSEGEKVEGLVVEWLDEYQGLLKLSMKDTTGLELGDYRFDIEFTAPDGFITSAPTCVLSIQEDITW